MQVFQGSNSAYLVDPNPWVDLPFGNHGNPRWSVFFIDSQGYAIVQHASNYSQVTKANPAVPGEFLVAYGVNLGPVGGGPASGYPAPFNPLASSSVAPNVCSQTDSITVGTAFVLPTYVGLTPGIVGVYQINFQVPADVLAGDQQLTFGRTLGISPFGQCLLSGMGQGSEAFTSRPALLPIQ